MTSSAITPSGEYDHAHEASLVGRRADHAGAVEHDREIGAVPAGDVLDRVEQDLALHLELERRPPELGHVVAVDEHRGAGAHEVLGGGFGIAGDTAGKRQRAATGRPRRTLAVRRRAVQRGQLLGEVLGEPRPARPARWLRRRPPSRSAITESRTPSADCLAATAAARSDSARSSFDVAAAARSLAWRTSMRASFNSAFASIGGVVGLGQVGAELVDLTDGATAPAPRGRPPRRATASRPARPPRACALRGGVRPPRRHASASSSASMSSCVDALGPAVGTLEPQDPDRIDELGNGAGADARPERVVGLEDAAERTEGRRRQTGQLHVRLERGRVLERRPQLLALLGDRRRRTPSARRR